MKNQQKRRKSPLQSFKDRLMSRFGLSIDEYEKLLAQQGGVCAICKEPPTSVRRLAVDHDHRTGKHRGLLCVRCNTALGKLDDATRLDAVRRYLKIQDPGAPAPITAYLAGAIRDDHPEDIEWREQVIRELAGYPIRFLNPLAGKTFDPETKKWSVSGIPSSASLIVKHDFHAVDASDVVLFNFRALSQGYPNLGTLVEFGRATARGCLIYAVVDPDYKGHGNTSMYKLHPFLAENSAAIFATMDECLIFLKGHVPALAGTDPHFRPYGGA